MLVDEIEIIIKAGDGGHGSISFGKGSKSGPDGGNGGDGGDVYLKSSSDLTLLSQFHPLGIISAENGGNGSKEKRAGGRGNDLVIMLPVGSKVIDNKTNKTTDFDKVGETVLYCKGGAGGIGNYELRSSKNVAPMYSKPPTPGQKRRVKIILSFIADFGLIGLPSSGKSSLLNELTSADVKTGAYHFTTLSPNLGVLPNSKIIADIPGLIEGASEGRGLGIKFLKHIEKVGLLLHCISTDSKNHLADYKIIRNELGKYNKDLLKKKEIIVLTKSDLVKPEDLKNVKTSLKKLKKKIVITSIYDRESLDVLSKLL
jgi:GTPase